MSRLTKTPLPKSKAAPHDIAKRSEQRWVGVKGLKIDHSYQRPVNGVRVARMAEHFDPEAFGTLTLSERENGEVYIIDGQHRAVCLDHMGWGDQQVPSLVYIGLTVEEEARIFRLMNAEATAPKAIDIFRARLTEEEPTAVDIDKIVRSLGLQLNNAPGKGHVQAIAATERVFVQGGAEVLRTTLAVLKDAYGHLDDGTQTPYVADLLTGVAVIFARYGKMVDKARLTRVLSRATPQALLRDARATAQAISATSIAVNVVPMMLVQRYNTRIDSTKKLPQWEIRPNKSAWKPLTVQMSAR